jgi:hypothetical protein
VGKSKKRSIMLQAKMLLVNGFEDTITINNEEALDILTKFKLKEPFVVNLEEENKEVYYNSRNIVSIIVKEVEENDE